MEKDLIIRDRVLRILKYKLSIYQNKLNKSVNAEDKSKYSYLVKFLEDLIKDVRQIEGVKKWVDLWNI